MRRLLVAVVPCLLTFALIGAGIVTQPSASAYPSTDSTRSGTQITSLTPALVNLATPYVVRQVNSMYNLKPLASKRLSSTQYASVMNAIESYNALPASVRIQGSARIVPAQSANTPYYRTGGGGGCDAEVVWYQHQWWGTTIQWNECATQQFILDANNWASTGAVVAAVCGGYDMAVIIVPILSPGVPFATACVVVAGIYAAAMWKYSAQAASDDFHCGNRGIFFDVPYAGPAWVDSIC